MPTPTTTEEAIEKEHSDWNVKALERERATAVRRLERYAKDPEIRKRENTRKRDRYANDPEIRERENTRCREWRSEHTVDPEWRARESARGRERRSEHTVEHTVDPVKFRNMYSQSGRPLRIPESMKDETFALIDNGKGDQELLSLPDLDPHRRSGWAGRLFKGRLPGDMLWNGDLPPPYLVHATPSKNADAIMKSGVILNTVAVRDGREAAHAGVFFRRSNEEMLEGLTNEAIPSCRRFLQ